ncbi:Aspartic proteinase nepenthesin-1 [Dichanthelium oligosanthes]|uniref:Aspartic proteinase nepenthesin-1 n=1 Tax=Dichanthelium oligosanthes TaxID=888268 RepID=A0A1E5UTJ2_9POAL|nr:Aspartic proteinase nepenthesin-1 [Dichanthelium oligosanthes]
MFDCDAGHAGVPGLAFGPVLLGLPAKLYSGASGAVQTTPLIQSSSAIPTFYYLSLKSITVGSMRLPVPELAFALTSNGSGGMVIDSGTSVTTLPPLVYGLLHDAFVAQVDLAMTNDEPLCFAVSSSGKKPEVPKLVLQFEGSTLDLLRENYVFSVEEGGQSNMCIAVVSSGGDMTIIGNYQQQNLHVLYDLTGNQLSFIPAHYDKV